MRMLFVLTVLAWAGGPAQAQPARPFPAGFRIDRDSPWQREVEGKLTPRSAGIFVGTWNGWTNSLVLQATNVPVEIVVAPTAGGRILRFSLDGENILLDPAEGVASPSPSPASPLPAPSGGYQCDIGPELRGLPERRQLLIGRHLWSSPGDWQVQVNSGRDAATGLEIQKAIRLDPETGGLHLVQWLVNRSAADLSYGLRDRTVCKSGGFVLFPLHKKSRYSAGWALRRKAGDGFTYDGATPFSPRVRVLDGVLIAQAGGEPTKLGADTDAGWIAYTRGKLLFVKFFAHDPDGQYTDAGNTVEVSWDAQSVELEPLSPEVRLRQHRPYGWTGRWLLLPLEQAVATYDQARALADRVTALKNTSAKPDMARGRLPWSEAAERRQAVARGVRSD